MPADLGERLLEGEAMDDPAVDPVLHRDALEQLARFNSLAGCAGTVARELERLPRRQGGALRVLDLATGSGDMPCRWMRHAVRGGLSWSVDGADIAPLAVQRARDRAAELPAGTRPSFLLLDALRDPLPQGYDVVTCSLFLHHLSTDAAVELLAKMRAAAKRAIVVQDLVRSPAALRLAWLATHLFSRNPLIRSDGAASVAAAFTLDEARDLARRAGLGAVRIERRWPYRWILVG